MTPATSRRGDAGMALMTTMMVMLLLSSLLVGYTVMVTSDNQLTSIEVGRTGAFYAAHAGLEQLTADLGTLFSTNFAPTGDQVRAFADAPPALQGVTFQAAGGTDGYTITFDTTTGNPATGDPVSTEGTVNSGPFEDFVGLATEYNMNVTARLVDGAESSLQRVLQTVSIPVFQFGTFSETDLSFFPGPAFSFGGRTHTNGNLFLAAGSGGLTLSDRVTAVGEVIRTHLSNETTTAASYTGTVNVPTAPGTFRPLGNNEGSLTGMLGSPENEPTWTNLSTGTYNSYIMNGRTGAKRLDLPLVSQGAEAIDLIRRPLSTETENSPVFMQRHFALASLRILLSDSADDITSLPTVTATPPVALSVDPYGLGPDHPPVAVSSGIAADGYRTPVDTPLLGGFLKIDMQTADGNWQDVTAELLDQGIAGRSLLPACVNTNPNPNAVIRLQRVREDGNLAMGAPCGEDSTDRFDYWPNVLYDPREGLQRDTPPAPASLLPLGGVVHHVELDVANLKRWFDGALGVSGPAALNQNGYVVYFSDRRGNRDAAGQETGDYGFEDFVNPASSAGTPNNLLDTGEDVNANGQLDAYGQFPIVPAGATAPLTAAARPTTLVTAAEARANRAILFRRALKLVNGGLNNVPMPGLTIASENPVYVQGDVNASGPAGGFVEPNAATAILADAVTLLSNSWDDRLSFTTPHTPGGRQATTTWYRVAIIAGKGPSFPHPAATPQDFGTDGGTHNFLRYLEGWSGQTLNYRGALVSFFFNRQATGTYKCCATVYSPPDRAFDFDQDFRDPSLLPPATPMFRDVNITGFTQIVRPTP